MLRPRRVRGQVVPILVVFRESGGDVLTYGSFANHPAVYAYSGYIRTYDDQVAFCQSLWMTPAVFLSLEHASMIYAGLVPPDSDDIYLGGTRASGGVDIFWDDGTPLWEPNKANDPTEDDYEEDDELVLQSWHCSSCDDDHKIGLGVTKPTKKKCAEGCVASLQRVVVVDVQRGTDQNSSGTRACMAPCRCCFVSRVRSRYNCTNDNTTAVCGLHDNVRRAADP
jgi:hypothetical protein